MTVRIEIYQTADGKQPFANWVRGLKDQQARSRIRVRIARLQLGNLGDCKSVGGGLLELRIDHGPGYRVYLARRGDRWCYCSAVVTSVRGRRTSNRHAHTSPTTNRG